MRQTTLFDFQVAKLKPKPNVCEIDESVNHVLQKVIYKPSKNDFDYISGFDTSLTSWIYPTNYPVRDYQLQIVHQCLYKNTLVCLPTGLGKTFISVVVMFNFYRWYPNKKIIFVAPTKPLVRQQMLAASECVPIDKKDIVEMTGSISQHVRLTLWKEKRLFFLTAQVFVNDLSNGACPVDDVIMVVLDEAHKATGNHSYCQAIRLLSAGHRLFRVLGLSATPGNDIETIQSVIHNLLISHIELRTDECKDIQMYSFKRLIEEVIIPLGNEVISYRDRLRSCCEPLIDHLKSAGAINPHINVSKFGFLTLKREYKDSTKNASYIISVYFNMLISLYHAVELVQQHGLKPTFLFLSNALTTQSNMPHIRELMKNSDFMDIVKDLEMKFQGDSFIGGHPKLEKLKEIVKAHFEKYENCNDPEKSCKTRVMVFSQFRDSVDEILRLLEQLRPLVRPMGFVGRSKNGSQKEQLTAMRLFIDGTVNVLVSTCIGEEGLDVGEVDLIVCFDAQGSPIRLVQRLGRTGRKRIGRIVMLLSEGKEVQSYKSSIAKKSRIHSAIFEGYKHLQFYPDNPRLVPIGLQPSAVFQKFNLQKQEVPKATLTTSKSNRIMESSIRFPQISKISLATESPGHLRFLGEENHDNETFTQRYHAKKNRKSLYKAQKTVRIGHSSLTESVVSILKLKELHCRGKTNMIFHLSNSRIVDIEEDMSDDNEEIQSQHSLDSFAMSLSQISDTCYVEETRIKPCMPQEKFQDLLWDIGINKGIQGLDTEFDMSICSLSSDMSVSNVIGDDAAKSKQSFTSIEDFSDQEETETRINTEVMEPFPILEVSESEERFQESKEKVKHRVVNVEDVISISDSESDKEMLSSFNVIAAEADLPGPSSGYVVDSSKQKENLLQSFNDDENLFSSCTDLMDWDSNFDATSPIKDNPNPSSKFNISHIPLEASPTINDSKRRVLLNCFEVKDDNKMTLTEQLKTKFQTSTPIRKVNRKSLLDSFRDIRKENTEIGFDTALDLMETSDSIRYELSTDLFNDENEDEKEKSNSEKISSILKSFHIPSSTGEIQKIETETKNNVDSDEDLFSNEEHLFSDDDSFSFSPLANNLADAQTQKICNNVAVNSDESEDFLNFDGINDETIDTVDIVPMGSPSFESDGFVEEFKRKKIVGDDGNQSTERSSSFDEDRYGKEINELCGSPSFLAFGSDEEEEVVEASKESIGWNEVGEYNDGIGGGFVKPFEFKNEVTPRPKNKRSVRDFFFSQADTSGRVKNDDEEDDEDCSYLDQMENSFIDDDQNTQSENNTQMQQIYIRSIQSPVSRLTRVPTNRYQDIVDTQLPISEDYLCDSFVVADDYESPIRKNRKLKLDQSPIGTKRFKRLKVVEDSFTD